MTHEFKGKHYLASLKHCTMNLMEIPHIRAGLEAIIVESGATILTCNDYEFDGGGYTIFFLLSESHCSVHTYPEYGHIFIDYFTCGDSCDMNLFHTKVTLLFQPDRNDYQIIERE